MADRYHSASDVQMRIDHTICLWKGEPMYVTTREAQGRPDQVSIQPFNFRGPGGSSFVDYTSEDFQLGPLRLGYINRGNVQRNPLRVKAVYLSRIPSRRQKQGLSQDGIHCIREQGESRLRFPSGELYEVLTDSYPTVKRAKRSMEGAVPGIAIDREIAFKFLDYEEYGMYFREKLVGYYNTARGKVTLRPSPSTSIFIRLADAKGLRELFT